ncbi:MAG TPA: glycosyltransferase family 1 protein [Chitinophagaceae bacterium]|nr:glycosyltransferase family 1 protein [Chitinophagaceae bacterium]
MKEPLRIGIEAQRLFRPRKHGLEIVALESLRELQSLDKLNQYFIFVKDDTDSQCLKETENFHIVVLPSWNYAIWEQVVLPAAIRKYHLDIFHCTANTAPVINSVPTVITIHDIYFHKRASLTGTTYQRFGNLYRRMIFPRLANFQHLVTVSEYEKNNIVSTLKMNPDTITVVPNGVNPKFRVITDPGTLQRVREKYQLPANFILYFGNTAPQKNSRYTIHAFREINKQYPDITLAVVDPSDSYINSIASELLTEEAKQKLLILGFIEHDDLPAVYTMARIFIFPSLQESFGLPILEAQACETPVITSNAAAMPETAGGSCLLIDPLDPLSLYISIDKILKDEDLSASLVQKGKLNVQKYSWAQTAEKLLQVYHMIHEKNSKKSLKNALH